MTEKEILTLLRAFRNSQVRLFGTEDGDGPYFRGLIQGVDMCLWLIDGHSRLRRLTPRAEDVFAFFLGAMLVAVAVYIVTYSL